MRIARWVRAGSEEVMVAVGTRVEVDAAAGGGAPRVDATGREGAKGFITMLRGAFPDLHAVIHEPLGEGDVAINLIDILRLADGQMVEHWNVVDWLGLMQQLGVTPSSGATSQ
jgi:hypothetical protein